MDKTAVAPEDQNWNRASSSKSRTVQKKNSKNTRVGVYMLQPVRS